MKLCKKCNILKNEQDFYSKQNTCKLCTKKQQQEWIKEHPHYFQERYKNLPHVQKETKRQQIREWRKANPYYHQEYYKQHPEKFYKQKEYYQKYKEKYKAKYKEKYCHVLRQSKYNLTPEQYQTLLNQQKDICAICKQIPKKILNVDHDHQTGKVRGLLCRHCNSAIACFDDNNILLNEAINYLNKVNPN